MLAACDALGSGASAKKKLADGAAVEPLADWLDGEQGLPQSADQALACLAVAHLLPHMAEQLSAERWWAAVDALWQVAQAASDWCADCEMPADQVLVQQLLAGELPLVLAYLLPEIKPLYALRRRGRDSLSAAMDEVLNGEGWPQGKHLPVMRPLVACWTRCRAMGRAWSKGPWNRKTECQYQWTIRQALRSSTPTGQPMLASAGTNELPQGAAIAQVPWTADFLRTAIRLGGDTSDRAAACQLMDKKIVAKLDQPKSTEPPEPSDHCEWAGIAVMRTHWARKAPAVAVDYSTPQMRIEIHQGPTAARGRHLGIGNYGRRQAAQARRRVGRGLLV